MALPITQTDTAGVTAQACNARTVTGSASRAALPAGTAGSTPVSTVNMNSGLHLTKIAFSWTPDADVAWDAGTWTIRLNITTGNSNLTIEDVCVRRLNSSDVDQGSIGALTAQAVTASAGVKTFNVSGSSQTPGAGDKVLITLTVSNASGQMNQQFSWTPDQDIDTPFTVEAPVPAPNVSDTITPAEAVTVRMPMNVSVSDTDTETESVTVRIPERVNVFDTDTVAEATTVEIPMKATVSDTPAVTEQVTLRLNPLTVNALDTDAPAEQATVKLPMSLSVTDLEVAIEVVSLVVQPIIVNVSETDTPGEDVTVLTGGGVRVNVADAGAAAESVTVLHHQTVTITDTSSPTESVRLALPVPVSVQESLPGDDTALARLTLRIVAVDTDLAGELAQASNFADLTIVVSETRTVGERVLAGRKKPGAGLVRFKPGGQIRNSTMTGTTIPDGSGHLP